MKIFTKVILIVVLASSLFGQQAPATSEQPPKKDSGENRDAGRNQQRTFSSWPLCCMKLMTASEPTSAIT